MKNRDTKSNFLQISETVAKSLDNDTELLHHYPELQFYFEKQLKLIKDENLRKLISFYISLKPKFKMERPTSSTGKYHPSWQNDYGGNGKHTKNVVKILQVFERAFPNLRWDETYAAAILHDMSKYLSNTGNEYTHSDHSILEANNVLQFAKTANTTYPVTYLGRKRKKQLKFIAHLIKWHDGRFNCTFANKEQIKHNYIKGLMGKMKYKEACLLHLADMISANKSLWEELI